MTTDANPEKLLGSHWDFADLLKRLRPGPDCWHNADGKLRREAAGAIEALIEANKELHRRAQQVEGPTDSKINKYRRDAEWSRDWAKSNFDRMGNAFDEIKLIYEQIRRARPDGCDEYGYHSVMDSRFGGDTPPGTVWANKFQSKLGGIVSVRPAEVIGALIDELIAFRKFFGKVPHQ